MADQTRAYVWHQVPQCGTCGCLLYVVEYHATEVIVEDRCLCGDLNRHLTFQLPAVPSTAQKQASTPQSVSDESHICAGIFPTDEPGYQGAKPCGKPATILFSAASGWTGWMCR